MLVEEGESEVGVSTESCVGGGVNTESCVGGGRRK